VKVPDSEGVAIHAVLESCIGHREASDEALTEVRRDYHDHFDNNDAQTLWNLYIGRRSFNSGMAQVLGILLTLRRCHHVEVI
jgi:hypothetical protein